MSLKMTLDDHQLDIVGWARSTFGDADLGTLAARCNEEMAELITASQSKLSQEALQKVAMECADVFIVLAQVIHRTGLRLEWAVNEKMKINRARKWKTDGKGTGQHE